MSHVSKVQIEIKSLADLKKAAETLGLYFREQSTYRWFGKFVGDSPMPEGFTEQELGQCKYAIGIPGNDKSYEVGVVVRDGKIHLMWDFWQGGYGLEEAIGKDGCKLKQEYSLSVAQREMARRGFRTERVVNATTGRPRMRAWK